MKITKADPPWFVYVQFPYNETLKNFIKAIPGTSWDPKLKQWRVPIEIVELITSEATRLSRRDP